MSRKLVALSSVFLMLCSFASQAALITYSYANLDSSFDASDSLLDYYNSQTPIASMTVSEFDMEGTFDDSIMKVTFSFDLLSDTLFETFAGLDAGFGAEIYVNGVLGFDSSDDLWWSKKWNSSDVISFEQFLSAGTNTIDVVWAEECCGGLSSIAFTTPLNGGDLTLLSLSSLTEIEASAPPAPVSVNAPGTVGVLAISLLAMVRLRNKV